MTNSWVIKLKLADSTGAILISVTSKDSSKVLDLDLLATDGDAAFIGKVRTRSLDRLRAKHYDGSAEEWSSILKYGLVNRKSSQVDAAIKENLEIQCSISGKDPKSVLSISFRTLVQDITQQLGTIDLQQTEDTDDVDLFGWASQLADRRDELEDEAFEQQLKTGAEAEKILAIQGQLDELTQAKADHDQQLMGKFAMLLNEKKFELRRLQRILETAKVDPKQLKALKDSKQASGKRGQKRTARRNDNASEEDESDAFDNMDVDDQAEEDGGSDRENQTTDDDRTESADDDDLDQPATSQTEAGTRTEPKAQSKGKAPEEMPAPRELPFTRQKQKSGSTQSQTKSSSIQEAAADDDEETASEDDEL